VTDVEAIELTADEAHFANQDEYERDVPPASMPVWFHDHGALVFPIIRGTKAPACKLTGFRCTRERAASFTSYGVMLRQLLLVIDADTPHADAWVAAHVPDTPFTVTTGPYHDKSPGRGTQRYFRQPAASLPPYIHRDGLTIEARRGANYVLGPRSLHPDGMTYTPSVWSWQWADIPIFPADFVFDDGSCGARASADADADGERFEFPQVVSAGERHDCLFRLIRSWKHVASRDETREAVHLHNIARCVPPLVEDADFERWFVRAWNTADRPFPDAQDAVTIEGYDSRTLRRLGLRL
jgi:hypothetical protein